MSADGGGYHSAPDAGLPRRYNDVVTATTAAAFSGSSPPDPRVALTELFGYPEFRSGQEEVVRAVLAGEDVLAIMPTGAGKSLCYQLPAMLLPGVTVVVSPLIALMKDQLDSLPPAVREQAALFNSTLGRDELDAGMAELAAGRVKLLYVAPERLRSRPFVEALRRAGISRVVVDEAHCVSLWGHDFRPDYFFLPAVLGVLGDAPVLAMTATATPAVQAEMAERFGRPLRLLHEGVLRPNLLLRVERMKDAEEKTRRLIKLCEEEQGSGIVYVSSRERAEKVARDLYRWGIRARHYHAGLDTGERARVQDEFMRGQVRVIVATVAFGMGVDKSDVRFIAHFNPSRSLEAYAQESGRAGRDGLPASCVLFWASSDKTALGKWAREDALSRDALNAVYRALRAERRGEYAWWPMDRLREGLPLADGSTLEETPIRVAVGALEQVGAVRRHFDLPERFQVRVLDEDAPGAASLTAMLQMRPGEARAVDALELAEAVGRRPEDVEAWLLELERAGAITARGLGRGMLVELLPQPEELGRRVRELIEGHIAAQDERLEEMARYATGRTCRTKVIAEHFGVRHGGKCGHCDVCVPARREAATVTPEPAAKPAEPERAPADIVIECVSELPFPMGKTGVTNVLKGSVSSAVGGDRSRHFAALGALTKAAIEREITQLVEAEYLAWRQSDRPGRDGTYFNVLYVTPAGFAKEAEPWPPPRVASLARPASRPRPEGGGGGAGSSVEADDGPIDAEAQALYDRLTAWRREEASARAVSAFIVASNRTLEAIARARPGTLEELGAVKGVGPMMVERYGEALLALTNT